MQIEKLPPGVWDIIVSADKGAKTGSVSLTGEHAMFLEQLPTSFLKDVVRELLTRELESQPGYLEAMERKIEKELKAVEKQKANLNNKQYIIKKH